MKIGLLTSHRWKQQNKSLFQEMVEYLQSKGHQILTSDIKLEELIPMRYVEREAIFSEFYHKLLDCDVVFAECTLQSTQVGFGLAYLRARGKPIIVLSLREVNEMQTQGEVYSNEENLAVYEYSKGDMKSVINEALNSMESHIDKRFTIIFPADLMNQLEDVARKKKLPKSVFIRQLIEEDLAKNTSTE